MSSDFWSVRPRKELWGKSKMIRQVAAESGSVVEPSVRVFVE
jgi:hypothetical protein